MIRIYSLVLLVFISFSCEKEEIVENSTTYQQDIVVVAELNPEVSFIGVTFTKTLPVGVQYDIKAAELKKVNAYIRVNGVKIIPLHYSSDGVYKPLYYLLVKAGNIYELFAEWENTTIYGKTTVPFPPEIMSVGYNSETNSFHANVKSNYGEAYGAQWIIGNGPNKASTFPELSIPGSDESSTNVFTSPLASQYLGVEFNGLRNIQVYSYDKQYAAFYNSKRVTVPSGNAFLQNGGIVGWNVFGKNVIGIFIGVGKGKIKNVN